MPSYSHAMDALWCAAFLAYWAHSLGRRDLRRWITLGVWLGVAMLVRTQELALGRGRGDRGDSPRSPTTCAPVRSTGALRALLLVAGGVLLLVVALVVFVPQLVEWKLVFGSATRLPQGPRYTRPGSPMILEVLFSARNGWFSTTPLAYAGVLGLFLPAARGAARHARPARRDDRADLSREHDRRLVGQLVVRPAPAVQRHAAARRRARGAAVAARAGSRRACRACRRGRGACSRWSGSPRRSRGTSGACAISRAGWARPASSWRPAASTRRCGCVRRCNGSTNRIGNSVRVFRRTHGSRGAMTCRCSAGIARSATTR